MLKLPVTHGPFFWSANISVIKVIKKFGQIPSYFLRNPTSIFSKVSIDVSSKITFNAQSTSSCSYFLPQRGILFLQSLFTCHLHRSWVQSPVIVSHNDIYLKVGIGASFLYCLKERC